ncbi:MAG TPA: hypothetical protein VN442_16830 [Bryobacteraceae bacterium]|nr:hypothetical protein [Bryobacteraceae bacterium]
MEHTHAPQFRERFEGLSLGGRYHLRRSIEQTDKTAYFLADAGHDERAIVRLDNLADDAAEAQISLWKRAAALPHPHLIRIFDVGEIEYDGVPAVWVAMEYPEENLGDVLRDRALTAEETGPALEAATAALAHLHAHGLAIGGVTPWSVVAVGDSVKLPVDGVRQAGAAGAAEDVRTLGLTTCEMLTRRVPAVNDGAPLLAAEDMPALAPFETFIRRALEPDPAKRWSAARLAAYLRNPQEAETVAPPPPPVEITRPHPVEPEAPVRARNIPAWWYAAGALFALVIVLVVVATSRDRRPAARPAPAPTAPAPPAAAPAARPAPSRNAGLRNSAPPGQWRVVAYTYSGRRAAEQKARSINGRFPQFQAEVFAPRPGRSPYLVVLGGRMTRDEAVELRRKARAKGLPRDTYVQNYER